MSAEPLPPSASQPGPPSRHDPSASGASRPAAPLDSGVCLCRVEGRLLAIETALVSEVIAVERLLPVPGCPAPVLGLFSLRGTPVAVVDLLAALGQPGGAARTGDHTVLVLRPAGSPLAALRIDRMEAVVPHGQGERRPVDPGTDHPAVAGVFEVGGRPPATLLDSRHLLAALQRLSFSNPERRNST